MNLFRSQRAFSTSAAPERLFAHVVKRRVAAPREVLPGDPDTLLKSRDKWPQYPPYPYGDATIYKQANRGLYGGKVPQYGHQISEWGNKHVRVFNPNVQTASLYSEALKRKIKMRVVTSVMRTITKEGGLDRYLLKDSAARIKELGPFGWKLRFEVLKRIEEHERTAPKPMPEEFAVGHTRLVKDLFLTTKDEHRQNLKDFMAAHKGVQATDLVAKLESAGVDTAKYYKVKEEPAETVAGAKNEPKPELN